MIFSVDSFGNQYTHIFKTMIILSVAKLNTSFFKLVEFH